MRVTKSIAQRQQSIRFFPNRQILALHVFNQRDLRDRAFVDFHLDTRHFLQSRLLRRAPTTLTGDDHPAPGESIRFDEQRLEHALLGNRRGELGEIAEFRARLFRVRIQLVHGYHPADLLRPVL